MKGNVGKFLKQIEINIPEIDFHDYNIVRVSFLVVHCLQNVLSDLRTSYNLFEDKSLPFLYGSE